MIKDNVAEEVSKQEPGRDILVNSNSAQLVRTLMEHDLIDVAQWVVSKS
jgi:hypothetical protein